MSKFIHALSVATIATVLLIGESPTQAQSQVSSSAPGRSLRSVGINQMSAAARDAITQGAEIKSIPHFSGSFTTDGVVYPFIMLGGNPTQGGITRIHTEIIPLEFQFLDANGELFLNDDGTPLTLGPSAEIVQLAAESPLFQNAKYSIDKTQFTDAIQQASFFSVEGRNWHTLLSNPKVHKPDRITVPFGKAFIQNPDVIKTFAICLEFDFLASQLLSILQSLPLNHLALVLSLDTIVYDGFDELLTCTQEGAGTVGFHTVVDRFATKTHVDLQVFAYSAWLTPPAAVIPDFEDIAFLAHEVVEAVNDPFIGTSNVPGGPFTNFAPEYMNALGGCQHTLETGDFIEGLASRPSQLRSTISHIIPRMSSCSSGSVEKSPVRRFREPTPTLIRAYSRVLRLRVVVLSHRTKRDVVINIVKILSHLGLPTRAPPRSPARRVDLFQTIWEPKIACPTQADAPRALSSSEHAISSPKRGCDLPRPTLSSKIPTRP